MVVALSTEKHKNTVCVSGATEGYSTYDRKRKEVNTIKQKYDDKHLNFVDNGNINPRMLNKSLNKYVTTPLASNFCYTMNK